MLTLARVPLDDPFAQLLFARGHLVLLSGDPAYDRLRKVLPE